MLVAHLHDLDIPVCCGFPVGNNSCVPLIEGAPCTLDVALDKAVLTYNMEGATAPCEVDTANPTLFREKQI